MTVAGQVIFVVLAAVGLATVVALGPPRTYRDRGVAWYLSSTAWAALLFDASVVLTGFGIFDGAWAEWVILASVVLRGFVQVWLLTMVVQMRRRRSQ